MTARLAIQLLFAVTTLSLAACAPPAPYAPPADLTAATAATLVGSRLPVSGLLDEDVRTIISAVDGKPTGIEKSTWDKELLVSPGTHTIQIAALQGALRGEIAVRVTLDAGRSYAARSGKPVSRTVTSWLEDQTSGVVVSDKLVVVMGGGGRVVPLLVH